MLENSNTIINNPDSYYINIPHLTILNDIQNINISLYLDSLLEIWKNKQMIYICPQCNKPLYIYFLRMKHYFTKKDIQDGINIKTSEVYGTCPNCDSLIVYELTGDDGFALTDISIPNSIVSEKKDKMYHQPSTITPYELVNKLTAPEEDSSPFLLEEPIILKKSGLPKDELKQMKIDTYKHIAYYRMTTIEHLCFSYKTNEEKEVFIQERVKGMMDNDF